MNLKLFYISIVVNIKIRIIIVIVIAISIHVKKKKVSVHCLMCMQWFGKESFNNESVHNSTIAPNNAPSQNTKKKKGW